MTKPEAEHVSRLASPIYAAMLTRVTTGTTTPVSEPTATEARQRAIAHALALWQDTQATEIPNPL